MIAGIDYSGGGSGAVSKQNICLSYPGVVCGGFGLCEVGLRVALNYGAALRLDVARLGLLAGVALRLQAAGHRGECGRRCFPS